MYFCQISFILLNLKNYSYLQLILITVALHKLIFNWGHFFYLRNLLSIEITQIRNLIIITEILDLLLLIYIFSRL